MDKNWNYAKKMLFGALICSLASPTFVGCKDYDDDIDDLQKQITENKEAIEANKKALEDIQAAVKAGAILSSVEKTANGITIKLSNGNTYTITNGVDGKDGVNGKDGVDGKDGENGKDATLPIFTVENGLICADGKPISDVKIPTIADFSFAIDEKGELIFNEKSLGVVVGENGNSPKITLDFEETELVIKVNEEEVARKDLKGATGADANLDNLKFQINEGVLEYSKDGGESWVATGKVTGENGSSVTVKDFNFSIQDGVLYLGKDAEKKEIGNILLPSDLTINDAGYLNVFGQATQIRITGSYMIKSETELTICMPVGDEKGNLVLDEQGKVKYETVTIPVSLFDANALKAISIIPFEDQSSSIDMSQFQYYADADKDQKTPLLLTTTQESKLRMRVFPQSYDLIKAHEDGLITFQAETGYVTRNAADRPTFTISKIKKVEDGLFDIFMNLNIPEAKDYPATIVVNNVVANFGVRAKAIEKENAGLFIQAFKTIDGKRIETSLPTGTVKIGYNGEQAYTFDLEIYWQPENAKKAAQFPFANKIALKFIDESGNEITAAKAKELGFAIEGMTVKGVANTTALLDKKIKVVIYTTVGEETSLGTITKNTIEFVLVRPDEAVTPTTVYEDQIDVKAFPIASTIADVKFDLTNKNVWAGKLEASIAEFDEIKPELEDADEGITLNADETGFSFANTIKPGNYSATVSYMRENKVVKVTYNFTVTSFTVNVNYKEGYLDEGIIYVSKDEKDGVVTFKLDLAKIVIIENVEGDDYQGYTLNYETETNKNNEYVNVTETGEVTLKAKDGIWTGFDKEIVLTATVVKSDGTRGEEVTLAPIKFNNPLKNVPELNSNEATLKNVVGVPQSLNIINFFQLTDKEGETLINITEKTDKETDKITTEYEWNEEFATRYGIKVEISVDENEKRISANSDTRTITWTGIETSAEFVGMDVNATITITSTFWKEQTLTLPIKITK